MAAKSGDREFVERENDDTLYAFEQLLQKIEDYLLENGCIESVDDSENEGEQETLRAEAIVDLKQNLAKVNLKFCEEKIAKRSQTNYGKEHNAKIREIRNKFEQFDYRSVRELVDQLIEQL